MTLTDQDRDHIGRLIKEAIAKDRRYASFFDWPGKDQKEVGVALTLFESLLEKEGLHYSQLHPRGQGNDPPDCEAVDASGVRIGIEVTELVDPQGIKNAKSGRIYDWASWDEEKVADFVMARIIAKDQPTDLKGGPYNHYWVVIFCDEPGLPHDRAKHLLKDWAGATSKLIDEAFLLFSYDPSHSFCPYIRLPVARAT